MHCLIPFLLFPLPILSSALSSRQTDERTTLNDISTLCMINFSRDPATTIICLKDGASTTFTTRTTTYLRNGDDAMCCDGDNDVCMLSNHTVPVVACYKTKDKRATIAQDGAPCELNAAGDGCVWTGRSSRTGFSTKGVLTVRAVKDGKAVLDGSGSGGGGKTSGASNGVGGVKGLGGMVIAVALVVVMAW